MKKLIICGSGIKALAHLTKETQTAVEQADHTLYLINEPIIEEWIQKHANRSENLEKIYFDDEKRKIAYQHITNHILTTLKKTETLCVIFYGHPCVYARSALDAARIVKHDETVEVLILPGISAENCLYADLMINPAEGGCQSYDATDFLLYDRPINNSAHLILWQIGMLGMLGHERKNNNHYKLYEFLQNKLKLAYDETHKAIIYEASQYPLVKPNIKKIELNEINEKLKLSKISTLYIPPIKTVDTLLNRNIFDLLD